MPLRFVSTIQNKQRMYDIIRADQTHDAIHTDFFKKKKEKINSDPYVHIKLMMQFTLPSKQNNSDPYVKTRLIMQYTLTCSQKNVVQEHKT